MKLPPKTLKIGTTSRRKDQKPTKAVAGIRHTPRSMIFGLNCPVTVVNCRRAISLRWMGNKSDEKKQDDAAQRRRLIDQRRFLPREIDDLWSSKHKSPRARRATARFRSC